MLLCCGAGCRLKLEQWQLKPTFAMSWDKIIFTANLSTHATQPGPENDYVVKFLPSRNYFYVRKPLQILWMIFVILKLYTSQRDSIDCCSNSIIVLWPCNNVLCLRLIIKHWDSAQSDVIFLTSATAPDLGKTERSNAGQMFWVMCWSTCTTQE